MSTVAPSSGQRWLRAREVAALLGVSERMLRILVHRGDFPAPKKRGRKWARWPEQQVQQCLHEFLSK